MHSPTQISYAQRFEDFYLLRCFGNQPAGFYIDVGAGHPVYDNVSFAFYLKGWHGITVEPNPTLARMSRAVRPRDHAYEALMGSASGEATYYLVRDFHGLSTTDPDNALAAQSEFGKAADELKLPVVTLRELCDRHTPDSIDFLKIDVEGAEKDVLAGNDWEKYRPKVVLAEALAPFTMAPAWDAFEPILTQAGYRYVWFDSLNRYYLAEEAADLAVHFDRAPQHFGGATQFGDIGPAVEAPSHPDHTLAHLLTRGAMTRIPLLDPALLLDLVTAGIPESELAIEATEADIAIAFEQVFGYRPRPKDLATLDLPASASLHDIYGAIVGSEPFRIACGRISASYAF